ncbi:MAG: hypothetical protein U9O87_00075 [Verrucomicrobiota bacterium]|nr:hypothetical protein [Verrucomicrobiota bacterium]
MKKYILILLINLIAIQLFAGIAIEMKIFRLKSLSNDDAIALATPLLSPEGKVNYVDTRQMLVVYDYSENIEKIAEMITQTDIAPVNIFVDVAFNETINTSNQELGIEPQDIKLKISKKNGIIPSGSLKARLINSKLDTSSLNKISLLTIENREARIWVGKTVPHLEWFFEYGWRHHYWKMNTVWQDIGVSLWIKPKITGKYIDIEVYPKLTIEGNTKNIVQIKELTTHLRVLDGQSVKIGGLNKKQQEFYSKLFGFGKKRNSSVLNITLTPKIQHLKK